MVPRLVFTRRHPLGDTKLRLPDTSFATNTPESMNMAHIIHKQKGILAMAGDGLDMIILIAWVPQLQKKFAAGL